MDEDKDSPKADQADHTPPECKAPEDLSQALKCQPVRGMGADAERGRESMLR